MSAPRQTLCPSAQPDMEEAKVIGVVRGTADAPEMAYLAQPQPVTEELLALARPVKPTEVFRFAAKWSNSGCKHFGEEEGKCNLAEKIVRWAPIAVEKLPPCSIRPDCRWWQQEGRAACIRCPQMVTERFEAPEPIAEAADPSVA